MSNTFDFKNYNYQSAWQMSSMLSDPALMFHDGDNNIILEISSEGKVTWHRKEQADEAAELLVQHIKMTLERKAGIVYERNKWEDDIRAELARISEVKEITPEIIDEVFKKHKMVTVLQGKYHGKAEAA